MKLTRDEQIAELKRMGSGKLFYWARPGMFVLVAGLGLIGSFTGNPAFYATMIFAGLVALAVWLITPHMIHAVRGLREGVKQNGTVLISRRQWSDGGSNHESYQGLISMNNQPLWEMDFVQPQGWEPVEGLYQAELAFIRGVEWPVVLLTDDGLLYPNSKPKRTSLAQI